MAFDIYQDVTDRIVSMLERGVRPWSPQWDARGSCPVIPTRANGEPYKGINVALLWGAAEARGFTSQQWMTFNQAKELGGCVRKGAKAERVVYWGTFKAPGDDGEDGDEGKARLFAKSYSVFNVCEIDGLPDRFYSGGEPLPEVERIANAEAFVHGVGADIRHGGNRAFFSPSGDFVQMPPAGSFNEIAAYYGTLTHELTHWTGHKPRLDRQFGKRFGDKAYAVEELVAEIGAAFALARLGVSAEPREDHASYLASWLKVLKEDKRAIFTAASKAQAACDLLFKLAGEAKSEPVAVVPSDVICLPYIPSPDVTRDEWREFAVTTFAPVETDDDGDDDPTPPVAPSPMSFSDRVAAYASRRGRVLARGRVAARLRPVAAPEAIPVDLAPIPARPFHPRRDPSLLEFLSVKGVCDDGGELSARDLDRWHREVPFRRRLVRADGVSLETAARMAWEAGYFDDVAVPSWDSSDNMHPVTPDMLVAAMDRELRADYVHVWGDHDAEFFA
ncbi:ArdC family protein [Brevundimonas nasdae]|uniref:Zincin-like metallopeptidase domain-containing protein n=1 Tax=Brevundimonas nasdae TaxID=172043 RepID=A0ACD4VKC9_9CAUL|nr:zincin-like metallopeptidase domain-containing protein [Brevundimonas nasdae]WOB78475.1 zincin-like metallopeptidase domain-containing protein [Brevundimonas nasdae]